MKNETHLQRLKEVALLFLRLGVTRQKYGYQLAEEFKRLVPRH